MQNYKKNGKYRSKALKNRKKDLTLYAILLWRYRLLMQGLPYLR